MPCRAGSAVYPQREPYLRGDFRYGFFYVNRKLRSYYIKSSSGIALRRRRKMSQERPAAGGEACRQDSFLLGENMETRIALIGIIVESTESVEQLNHLLHEYGSHIIGRMGIPYREKKMFTLSALPLMHRRMSSMHCRGKIGRLAGITAKTVYSNV